MREEIITRTDRARAKAAAGGGKSSTAIMQGFLTAGIQPKPAAQEKNMRILSARCKRLAGRSTVIGHTVFSFDKDGVMQMADHANVSLDFDVLCRQNGVQRLDEVVTAPVVAEEAPAPEPASAPIRAEDIAPPGAELPPPPQPEPALEVEADVPEAIQEEPAAVADAPVADDGGKKKSKRR